MILSGEQKEVYLNIKDFWGVRLLDFKEETEYDVFTELLDELKNISQTCEKLPDLLRHYGCNFRTFDKVVFTNGKDKLEIEFKGIDIEPVKKYFVIKLGELC